MAENFVHARLLEEPWRNVYTDWTLTWLPVCVRLKVLLAFGVT